MMKRMKNLEEREREMEMRWDGVKDWGRRMKELEGNRVGTNLKQRIEKLKERIQERKEVERQGENERIRRILVIEKALEMRERRERKYNIIIGGWKGRRSEGRGVV